MLVSGPRNRWNGSASFWPGNWQYGSVSLTLWVTDQLVWGDAWRCSRCRIWPHKGVSSRSGVHPRTMRLVKADGSQKLQHLVIYHHTDPDPLYLLPFCSVPFREEGTSDLLLTTWGHHLRNSKHSHSHKSCKKECANLGQNLILVCLHNMSNLVFQSIYMPPQKNSNLNCTLTNKMKFG